MRIQFYAGRGCPEHHLADALVVFEEAGLEGLCLSGIAVWARKDLGRGISVTLPSRPYQDNGKERRYDFVRGDKAAIKGLKATIVAEFVRQYPEIAAPVVEIPMET